MGNSLKQGEILIDEDILKHFTEQFAKAHQIALACLHADGGTISRSGMENLGASGTWDLSEDEMQSVLAQAEQMHQAFEVAVDHPCLKMFCLPVRLDGQIQILWLMAAAVEEQMSSGHHSTESAADDVKQRLRRILEFLDYQSRVIFAIKVDEMIAQEAMLQSVESEHHIKQALESSQTMTQILMMLDSDNGFGKIVDDILKMTCVCQDLSQGFLIRTNEDHTTTDMICEYARENEWYQIAEFQQIPLSQLPFYDGQSHVLSKQEMTEEQIGSFWNQQHMTGAVFHPIELNGRNVMYLGFCQRSEQAQWNENQLAFIRDVRRIVQSILSKRVAKNSLAGSYASLEAILENVGCGIYVVDPEQKTILYTNQKFRELFAKTIQSDSLNQLLFSDKEIQNENFFDEVYYAMEERWMDVHKTRITWVDGRKVSLCTIYDITDKKIYQKKMESQASNDFLTGLYNRMRCEQDLDNYIYEAKAGHKEGALLYIDLDDFKHINDGLGHQYGDVLLKAISHSLQRVSGIESNCYRMGGDEFVVIVTDMDRYKLDVICEQIQDIFRKPWFLKGEDYYCTMSMGIVCFPTDGQSVEDLIRKADMALFSAKKEGKNRIEYYNDKDAVMSHRRLDLEKNMRKATMDACKEFEVYYQPIMDVTQEGDPCCGAEALIRWNSTEMGFISPADFIPLAEYLGLINPIGDYVLRQAAERCKRWNEMGHPKYKVNVNLSVVQLLQNDIVKKVQRVIEETGINPNNLTLEVTESLAVNDMERMKTILGQLKNLGTKVALDDFGTGYSSLNHIREMPIDVIKIDRCFVEHLAEDDFSDAFVKMVAELARTLGVSICTEGVENTKQYEAIKKLQIGMIQGYYFSKPLKAIEFEEKYI